MIAIDRSIDPSIVGICFFFFLLRQLSSSTKALSLAAARADLVMMSCSHRQRAAEAAAGGGRGASCDRSSGEGMALSPRLSPTSPCLVSRLSCLRQRYKGSRYTV